MNNGIRNHIYLYLLKQQEQELCTWSQQLLPLKAVAI
jgi:hypothetical protein